MYSSWIKFAVGISSPFFAVYMLQYLNMDFVTYSLINAASIISSILVLQRWGRHIDKNGSKWMLGISGFLVPIVPVLWIIFKKPLILFIVELFSGAVWAAYNLSTSNFVMDATNSKNRLIMNSYYNFFIGVATFIGAMIGGVLMKNLPADYFGNIFYFVFGVSAALRVAFSLYFLRKIKEERFVDVTLNGPMSKRIITIHPKEGAIWSFIPRKKK
jgi:MFS family permease